MFLTGNYMRKCSILCVWWSDSFCACVCEFVGCNRSEWNFGWKMHISVNCTTYSTLIDSELVNGEMICALVGLRDGRMGNRGCFEKEMKYNSLHVFIDRSIYISWTSELLHDCKDFGSFLLTDNYLKVEINRQLQKIQILMKTGAKYK